MSESQAPNNEALRAEHFSLLLQTAKHAFIDNTTGIGSIPNFVLLQTRTDIESQSLPDLVMVTVDADPDANVQDLTNKPLTAEAIVRESLGGGKRFTLSSMTSDFTHTGSRQELNALYPGSIFQSKPAYAPTVIRELAKVSRKNTSLWQLLNITLSEGYQATNAHYLNSPESTTAWCGDYKVQLNTTSVAMAKELSSRFLLNGNGSRLTPDAQELQKKLLESRDFDESKRLIHALEKGLSKRLLVLSPFNDKLQLIAKFIQPFEEHGLLLPDTKSSILNNPHLLANKHFAKLKLARLKNNIEDTQPTEKIPLITGKLFVKHLLDSFLEDPTRHSTNIAIIQREIFPDARRPDGLSLTHLVNFSNYVQKGRDAQKPEAERRALLQPNVRGVAAEALKRILVVTTNPKATAKQAASHRVDDQIFVELFGMLVDPQTKS